VLLFAGCVILLFLFLDQLFDQKRTSAVFIASLLFALHPIHTEVVANIKSRDELLCFFFAFLCLNVFMKYVRSGKINQLIWGSFCFFLALLSKETVITFLAVIPLIFFFYRNENKKRSIYITISVVFTAIIFLSVRFSVLYSYQAHYISDLDFIDNALSKQGLSPESRIATAILILGYNIKLLFVPYPLLSDYSYNTIPFTHFSDPLVLLTLCVYIFLAIFSIKSLFKNRKDPYAFGILFFLITISLFSNIPFLIGTTMGERLLFFPSVGFCLSVAFLIEKSLSKTTEKSLGIMKNKRIAGIIIPICLVYAILTIDRNGYWLDNYTLYTADAKKSPNNSKLNYLVGYELQKNMINKENDPINKKKLIEEGIEYFKKAINIYPEYTAAHTILGYLYYLDSKSDSAEVYDKRAIALDPKNSDAMNNLACVYFSNKLYPEAIELYKNASEIKPDFVDAYANIGICKLNTHEYDSAIFYSKKALSLDHSYKKSYVVLATTYKITGNTDSAKKYEALGK
jgi:hypothetical protein